MPIRPLDVECLSELAPTYDNLQCIFIHSVLAALQVSFLVFLPCTIIMPSWAVAWRLVAFGIVNHSLSALLNKDRATIYTSDERYAVAQPEHAHEEWIFVNGIAAGQHWLKNDLNRLAITFGRPVTGIHNKTNGIVFDIIECLIQRSLNYATCDTRVCYRIVKQKLYDPELTKVILILHSQGAITGGLVIDWILQELPQDLLGKLEVYTFGNAANHFNNPLRHVMSQQLAGRDPSPAAETAAPAINRQPSPDGSFVSGELDTVLYGSRGRRNSFTSISIETHPSDVDRAISHIEHYAHTTDFAALWGVLHFATSPLASRTVPRFVGRVFIRSSRRGGHQFCQHYMDGMFPLERNVETGRLVGASEDNEFMESVVLVGEEGDASRHVSEAFESSWGGQHGFGSGGVVDDVDVHDNGQGPRSRLDGTVVRVKDLSRLWQYRNGRIPQNTSLLYASGQETPDG